MHRLCQPQAHRLLNLDCVIALIEIAAATLTVAAFVPQAWKIIKTRSTKDLSAAMWVLQVIGFGLWIGYGVAIRNWPIVVPNAISFAASCLILGLKLGHGASRCSASNAASRSSSISITSRS